MGPKSLRTLFTKSAIPSISERSKGKKRRDPERSESARSVSSIADASSLLSLRAIAIARNPVSVSRRAIPKPIPRLPPVTITLRMPADEFPGLSDRQGGNEIDCRRDLMGRKCLTTEPQDIVMQFTHVRARRL